MTPVISELLYRIANDQDYADRYFADPASCLDEAGVLGADRDALLRLDRAAVLYLDAAPDQEPGLAPEHPGNNAGNRWLTIMIGLWGCVAFVLFWLLTGKTL